MLIECSECGDRRYLAEPVPYGKAYLCKKCRTLLILPKEEKLPATKKERKLITAIQQAAALLLVTVLLVCTVGTSVATAKTTSEPRTPLEGIIAVLSGAPTEKDILLEDVQSVVAQYERSIVSDSLQCMRIIENIPDVSPVTIPTNNMATFPTPQNPLFPDYLNWKYSQFKYTVDENGIVSIEIANVSDDSYQ